TPILSNVKRVLDIGAGTGLLSLMLAQRTPGIIIDAIEYDPAPAGQANANIAASSWKDRINILEGDVRNYSFPVKYDLIISNPPFFNNSLLGGDADKNRARHTLSLSYADLLKAINENLADGGYVSVLLPYPEYLQWKKLLAENKWFEFERLSVSHRPGAEVKRVVCLFSKKEVAGVKENTLAIHNDQHQYTPAFIELLAPFYLNL
ncbi:MAG: tRNA1(Val) (adenine(37)-N6)-methyltransferase, partial [Chitinophagales bacterium]